MTYIKVFAIDPSLSSTGYAYNSKNGGIITGTIKPKNIKGINRLIYIEDTLIPHVVLPYRAGLSVIEGYAMGINRGGRTFDLGELGGILRRFFYKQSISMLVVPPSNLKMFITGKGNADKELMAITIEKEYGKTFVSEDECDAYGLLMMGLGYCTPAILPRDREHHKRKALFGCQYIDCVEKH